MRDFFQHGKDVAKAFAWALWFMFSRLASVMLASSWTLDSLFGSSYLHEVWRQRYIGLAFVLIGAVILTFKYIQLCAEFDDAETD